MIDEKSIIDILIKASIESAPQPKIYIELYDSHIISQFHTMIIVPFGLGKTSKAMQIPNSHILYNYTFASMVGTINKDGDLIESDLMNACKKVLVIDEGHRLDDHAKDALLNLLSNGTYSRSLGYKIKQFTKQVGSVKKGFMIRPCKSGSSFDLYAQFSCVFFCEWLPKKFRQAFSSRFIPVILEANYDDVYDFARGISILGSKLNKFDFTIYKDEIRVPADLHDRFVLKHKELTTPFQKDFSNETMGYISRNIINLIKLACHFSRLRGRTVLEWLDFERVIPLIIPTMKWSLQTKLTLHQFKILSMLNHGMSQKDISVDLGITEASVSDVVSSLRMKGMLE